MLFLRIIHLHASPVVDISLELIKQYIHKVDQLHELLYNRFSYSILILRKDPTMKLCAISAEISEYIYSV